MSASAAIHCALTFGGPEMRRVPISPNRKVLGLLWFARMIDKIRLYENGALPKEYHEHLGVGYDGWCLRFLGVSYVLIRKKVLEGLSDETILRSCFESFGAKTEIEISTWNDCIRKRGWRDSENGGSQKLEKMKALYGYAHRADIETFFDLYDADEGRQLSPNK